jgi:hypothetical protein
MSATTIDEVLARLNAIIDHSLLVPNRIGYFASLYARVTSNVRRGILSQVVFEDNVRMALLDVVFANRFIDAYDTWRAGGAPSQSWQVAFLILDDADALVVQHLILGMNAHINLDLGIAAAEMAPNPEGLASLRNDFLQINVVLSRLVDIVQAELATLSPRIGTLEMFGAELQDRVFDFGMAAARDGAWALAERLVAAPKDQWAAIIAEQDDTVAALGRKIYPLKGVAGLAARWIRDRESTDIRFNVQVMAS